MFYIFLRHQAVIRYLYFFCFWQITRRVGIGLESEKKKISVGHFEVSSCEFPPLSALNIEVESTAVTPSLPAPREYLRVYNSDYLGVSQANKPKFADLNEKTVDCDDWLEWIRNANQRTRVDAYPLLLVCKELLDRLVRRELTLISRRTEDLAAALERAQAELAAQTQELDALRRRLEAENQAISSLFGEHSVA